MSLVLFHHPYSRAAKTVWMLEEVGAPYELRFVDMLAGGHKSALAGLNPMGKIPTITDGDTVVTEAAAIGLYLADRYAPGRLAPPIDDPRRAAYLRWSLFAPSVIEPAAMAKHEGWTYKATAAGWGTYEAMVESVHEAIKGRDFVLGSMFSMADIIFGGTVEFMLQFSLIQPTPALTAYAGRLQARPAHQRAEARNLEVRTAHGLK